ncbi:MAG: lipid-binding SYLF domain-containing protein [Desulfomonile tiedjei]|uniref:Lipid-binding SYLF domain-containing protein n=1 Tax=Desulfomonile tiedjei TaxID=2358 RepID=A0A9D6V7H2_9BACT|nr:lipid-binding SYLF domain-containing protein [Desulfomonile tiedjei]
MQKSLPILAMLLVTSSFFSSPVFCVPPMELEQRLSDSVQVLKDVIEAPDAGVPIDLLKRSRGIVVFPSLIKAGLGIGGHYGKGVVLRRDTSTGKWGPPAFIRLIGGSFGWQIGVQSTDMVLLIMNEVSLKSLFKDKITIGADASIAAGPVGRDASAATDVDLSAGILSYSRAKGLFAGVSIKGSVIEPDWEANEAYYGSDLSVIDIFFKGKGKLSPAAAELIRMLNKYGS